MSLLLIVRCPEKISQAYQALNETLSFEQDYVTRMTLSDREVLLGVWIDPTSGILNSPDIFSDGSDESGVTPVLRGCRIVDSFSLSGVWAVYRLEFDPSGFMTFALQREILLKLFFSYQQSVSMFAPKVVGRFSPVFESCDSEKDIHSEIRRMQLLCPGMITDFLMYDSLNGICRIEKQGDFSSHESS